MQPTATGESLIHIEQVLIILEGYLLSARQVPGTTLQPS